MKYSFFKIIYKGFCWVLDKSYMYIHEKKFCWGYIEDGRIKKKNISNQSSSFKPHFIFFYFFFFPTFDPVFILFLFLFFQNHKKYFLGKKKTPIFISKFCHSGLKILVHKEPLFISQSKFSALFFSILIFDFSLYGDVDYRCHKWLYPKVI